MKSYLNTKTVKYWRRASGSVELVHPLSPDFSVCGGTDVVAAARRWAIDGKYMLVSGVPPCAHAFYGMSSCPGQCYGRFRQLDHANVWASVYTEYPSRVEPFLLSSPYSEAVECETALYASSHGLLIKGMREPVAEWLSAYPDRDGWYGHGTLPIRFTPEDSLFHLGQLDELLLLLIQLSPVTWPDDDEVEDALAEADAAYRKSIE